MLQAMAHGVSASGPGSNALLVPYTSGDSVWFSRETCERVGKQLAAEYQSAKPFPHVALTDLLPVDILTRVLHEFPMLETGRFADAHSNLKTGYQLEKIKSPYIHSRNRGRLPGVRQQRA